MTGVILWGVILVVLGIATLAWYVRRNQQPSVEAPPEQPATPHMATPAGIGPAVQTIPPTDDPLVTADILADEMRFVDLDVWVFDLESGRCLRVTFASHDQVYIERTDPSAFRDREPGQTLKVEVNRTEVDSMRVRAIRYTVEVVVGDDLAIPLPHGLSPIGHRVRVGNTGITDVVAAVRRGIRIPV